MNGHYLSTPLRRALEKSIRLARQVAEDGARDAIRRLGVAEPKPPAYLGDREKDLRRRLRAHARALGDTLDKASDKQETRKLVEATAYAHWHRMLFARFLAERNLLRHPTLNAPITIEECRALAAEEELQDAWAVAERYAAAMLPAVFRIDDPVLLVDLDPAYMQKLTALVTALDGDTFQAEDSLGWTYQYWRAAEKEAVNESGVKIGADELPAVTQLFTEPYMVRFLLHNTLGAWWAGKRLAADPQLAATAMNEDELRAACSLPGYTFDMLRFVRDTEGPWRPAAGSFPGWPTKAADITMLDPCCGSGHFLTETLTLLAALRSEEENLAAARAVAAVLRDNLHGLEIDGRCVQIATFAVALTAWRIGSWQSLPQPHIAWVGSPPPLPKKEFVALAEGQSALEQALAALHDLFMQAPTLGSLIEPTGGDLVEPARIARIDEMIHPLLDKVKLPEPDLVEGTLAARGMADATSLLVKKYTLQATNVPFLGASEQAKDLSDYCARKLPWAKTDLAIAMIARILKLSTHGGTLASVTKQEWLFLASHQRFRERILQDATLSLIVNLGEEAWQAFGMRGPMATLTVLNNAVPEARSTYVALDATSLTKIEEKISHLTAGQPERIDQGSQLGNPGHLISSHNVSYSSTLSNYAISAQGLVTRDSARYIRNFWELSLITDKWCKFLSSPDAGPFTGRTSVLRWDGGKGPLHSEGLAHNFPAPRILERCGVAISQVRTFRATPYLGEVFNDGCVPIVPISPENASAILTFVESPDFSVAVRKVTMAVRVTNDYFLKVPFDLARWKSEASKRYPKGLPEPFSSDPTQWHFHGHPADLHSTTPLHIALARLSGYRWPAELDQSLSLSDEARQLVTALTQLPNSGTSCLLAGPSLGGEPSLPDRLRKYLAVTFGSRWTEALERQLVFDADQTLEKLEAKDLSLEAWVRDRAFRQHCALFHDRPFLWHIWDGLKDGFSVFVHYHRFDQAALRKLTYTTLGDWLARAKHEKNDLRYEKGRELQQKLEKILEGEKPFDIFVRWKALADQPLGWEPDLDDGVRFNIRPFVEAGVLRDTPKIKWTKDRGSDVASAPWYNLGPTYGGKPGDRINEHHTTLAEKRAAREVAKKAVGGKP